MRQAAPQRHALGLGLALLAGLAVALMDSSPGFDATGISAGSLILAGAVAGLVEGSGSLMSAFAVAAFVGGPTVLLERQSLPAPAIALAFAGIGAFSVAVSKRLLHGAADA